MRQAATALLAMTCFALLAWAPSEAQLPKVVSVGFVNLSGVNVNVQGYTIVNGVPRRGNILQMRQKGGMAFEPALIGPRFYTIADANQPLRVFLRDVRVNVPNRNIVLKIMPSPTNPKLLILVPGP